MYKILFKIISRNHRQRGFTLIELLVTIIIIGVLSALALTNLLAQVGKAREAELKNAMGTVSRGQMAYHWEKGFFCCSAQTPDQILESLGLQVKSKYIDSWVFDTSTVNEKVTFVIDNNNWEKDNTRGFSGGVFYGSISPNEYESIICESLTPSQNTIAPVATSPYCGADARRLR